MYKNYFKRLFDIVFSLLFLPILVIVLIIFGPIIYFEDRGNIIYTSERIGKHGDKFNMYKLRTMKKNSKIKQSKDGSIISSDSDSRLLKIGKILRKTSLDELPQFINVLKGDMSVIGPRPTMQVNTNEPIKNANHPRYAVKPGITGYTQAYYRNSIPQNEKFNIDAYYAEQICFTLDLKIFIKTISTVLSRKNVY